MSWLNRLPNLILIAVTVTIISVSTYWIFTDNKEDLQVKRRAGMLPQFSVEAFSDSDGAELSTETYRGKPMLVNFWASWCPPCRNEFPALASLSDVYRDRLNVLAVSTDTEKTAASKFIEEISAEKKLPRFREQIALGWDGSKAVSMNLFSVVRLPETFLVSADGRVVDKFVGEIDWMSEEVRARIERHLQP